MAADRCVTGALRSDETIDVLGTVDDIDSNEPLAGVSVRRCGEETGDVSLEGGTWSVPAPDAEWLTFEATAPGTLPALWVFDPRVEALETPGYRTDMARVEVVSAYIGGLGHTFDPTMVSVVIDALDPDTHRDLADVRVDTLPPGEAAASLSLDGVPILDPVTNGLHDVVVFNVPPGPVQVVAEALDGRTCAVAPPIQVDAGTVLGISTYCR